MAHSIAKSGLWIVLAGALLAAPALAGKGRTAVYDRRAVSIGALARSSGGIFVAEALSSRATGEGILFRARVLETFKGAIPSEIAFLVDDSCWTPREPFLAFAVLDPAGAWRLVGDAQFGAVPLPPAHRDAVLGTLRAHLQPDAEVRARALWEGFLGGCDRLRRDALVDLYREPGLLARLSAEEKSALVGPLGSEAGRASFSGELPALIALAGRSGTPAGLAALIAFVREPAGLRHADAFLEAFEAAGRDAAIAALFPVLEKETDARALPGVVMALAGLKAEPARARFAALLRHEDGLVRKFAILALGDLGGAASLPPLTAILLDEAKPSVERRLAVVALHRSGDPEGVRRLCDAQGTVADPALRDFIRAYREDPARERLLLLRTAGD